MKPKGSEAPLLTIERNVRSSVKNRIFPPGTKLFYGRSSSPSEARIQADSVDQQRREVFMKSGEIPEFIDGTNLPARFEDQCSGRSFARPKYEKLFQFALDNPQPRENKCELWIYNISRFGRAINKENMTVETREMKWQYLSLIRAGWHVRFLHDVPDGEELVQDFLFDIAAKAAAEYSLGLTRDTARGKYDYASKGFWTAGRAPFGTHRFCVRRQAILRDATGEKEWHEKADGKGQWITIPGDYGQKNSTILCPNPEELAIWNQCADMFLNRQSAQDIARWLLANNVKTSHNGDCWVSRTVVEMLTNPVLAGKIEYRGSKVEKPTLFDAKWEPMVDMAKYNRVLAEAERRTVENKKGVTYENFLTLPLVGSLFCAHCGLPMYAARMKGDGKQGGGNRWDRTRYAHAKVEPHTISNPEARVLVERFGCQNHKISADAVHLAVRDQLRALRSGPAWGSVMRQLWEQALNNTERSQNQSQALKDQVAILMRQCATLAEQVEKETDEHMRGIYADRARQRSKELSVAQRRLKESESERTYADDEWTFAEEILDETTDVLETWDSQDVEAQRRIIAYWVLRIDVEIPKGPFVHGKRKPFKLHMWFRNMPDMPISVNARSLSRTEMGEMRRLMLARDLDIPVAQICPVCIEVPCTCPPDTREPSPEGVNPTAGSTESGRIAEVDVKVVLPFTHITVEVSEEYLRALSIQSRRARFREVGGERRRNKLHKHTDAPTSE